jgi:hypothetical protein
MPPPVLYNLLYVWKRNYFFRNPFFLHVFPFFISQGAWNATTTSILNIGRPSSVMLIKTAARFPAEPVSQWPRSPSALISRKNAVAWTTMGPSASLSTARWQLGWMSCTWIQICAVPRARTAPFICLLGFPNNCDFSFRCALEKMTCKDLDPSSLSDKF